MVRCDLATDWAFADKDAPLYAHMETMQRLPVLLVLALAAGVSARAPQNPPCSHDRDCVKWHTHDRRSSCNFRTRECEDDAAFPAARLGAAPRVMPRAAGWVP